MTTVWFSRGCPDHLIEFVRDAGWEVVGPSADGRRRAHVAIAGSEPYTAHELADLPELGLIARTGIGIDAIDLAACTEAGVMVTNTPDGPTTSTAEHTMALMLAVSHELAASAARLRAGSGNYIAQQRSMELAGRTLGLVGAGRIGGAVARMAAGFDLGVLVHDPARQDSVPLDQLLARADIVSLHLPVTSETAGLFDTTMLAKMKPGSVLINCARGPIVVTDDLVAALQSGHLMGAGLDVTDPEPLPADHPLLHMDNVIVTPHIASSTIAGRARMERMAAEQVVMALRGQTPTELRNPAVLDHPARRIS